MKTEEELDARYPELSEEGKRQAQLVIDRFKAEMSKLAEETIDTFYTDVSVHIESDHWTNYANTIVDGLCNYGQLESYDRSRFEGMRRKIYAAHRDEIIKDLDQDCLKEIDRLKAELKAAYERRLY